LYQAGQKFFPAPAGESGGDRFDAAKRLVRDVALTDIIRTFRTHFDWNGGK
jgi:hypothetical protein